MFSSLAKEVVEKAEAQRDKVMEMTIDDMDLSVRSYNCLKRANINTVEDPLIAGAAQLAMFLRHGKHSFDLAWRDPF